jgi:gliding motility-associated-like protein
MRLGPDGRIYLPYHQGGMDVIVNPDATGEAVQYQKNAVAASALQLPNNIAGFTIGKQKDFSPAPLCTDSTVTFKPQVNYRVKQWQWNFGDQASGSNNTSTGQQPVHQFSGPGTYQVRLVTLNLCNEYDTVSKAVTVYPDPVIGLRDTLQVCYTQAPVPLAVTAYPSTQYRWNTGDTTAIIQATQSGWYTVKAYNPCNARQDSLFLSITPEVKALLPDDTVFCEGSSKVLDAGNAGASYAWSTGETTRTIQVYQPGTYWVRIRGGCNVIVDTSTIVFVPEEVGAFIPNVFTPNGDGFNDTFYGFALNTPDYRMSIYNRWGEAVFHAADPFTGWDGRHKGIAVPPGVYYYLITATDCSRRKVSYKGYVSLLR